jgi:hypothetical protein
MSRSLRLTESYYEAGTPVDSVMGMAASNRSGSLSGVEPKNDLGNDGRGNREHKHRCNAPHASSTFNGPTCLHRSTISSLTSNL